MSIKGAREKHNNFCRIPKAGRGRIWGPTGGVWVKALPCDTHRGAPKIIEGAGGNSSGCRRWPKFLFFAKKNVKRGFLYISGDRGGVNKGRGPGRGGGGFGPNRRGGGGYSQGRVLVALG